MKLNKIPVLIPLLFTLTLSQVSRAQWVVTDPANLIQNVIQVSGQVTQIANEAAQIANQVHQINNQIEQLRRVANGDFSAIAGLAAQQNQELGDLITSTAAMQYSLSNVQAQINNTYPQGSAQWGNFDMNTVAVRRQQWDTLITQAGATAAKAQTSLNRIANRNTMISNLMAASDVEGGDVRQAQIGNQIDAAVAQSLNDLIAVQTTSNRLAMIQAQTAVAERELARERSRRSLDGYTNSGPTVVPLQTFPAIQ